MRDAGVSLERQRHAVSSVVSGFAKRDNTILLSVARWCTFCINLYKIIVVRPEVILGG